MIMNDLDYVYLRTLPNFALLDGRRLWGKVLICLLKLTGLKTKKELMDKWRGFTIHELIYLDYEF